VYSTGIAYFLWLLSGFGVAGFHRFYLGKIGSGIIWLCSGGLFGIGSLYDFITLPSQVREANFRKAILDGTVRKNVNGSQAWRNVSEGEARIFREKDSVERAILKLAKTNKGILTASELALAANIPIEEAKRDLDAMISKGFAELRVRQSGTLVYTIPDFMDSNEPLVD
jgi:predicted transcriptional regulator